MMSPCCPVCESHRTLASVAVVGARSRVICTECGARWTEVAEDFLFGAASVETGPAYGPPGPGLPAGDDRPGVSPNHPTQFGRTYRS